MAGKFAAMSPAYVTPEALDTFIKTALQEDLGDGDHTSLGSIPSSRVHTAKLLIKDTGILAGVSMAEKIFGYFPGDFDLDFQLTDGDSVRPGDIAFTVMGNSQHLMAAERLVLNCMQRMSGIATYTHYLNGLIAGTGTRLLDTRKTTPNFRLAEKWAVAIGGGVNHRYGLFDMILLKDNHVDVAGGISKALKATFDYLEKHNKSLKIEIEIRNLRELEEALRVGGIDRVLLDNMSVETLREAVKIVAGKCETEASGGITEQTIRKIAETGVDFISVGALTHSFKSMDMSLKAL